MPRETKYTDFGYWAVQIGFSGLLALLGLGGGVYVLVDASRPDSTNSAGVGGGIMLILTGVVFLLLLIWLVVLMTSSSREQRAIYAWAIMQEHAARNPGARPLRPASTVAADVASMDVATRARNGALSLDEVLRLQALRPEVPYPGDLDALRRASAARAASLLTPEQRDQRRAQWAADDDEARSWLHNAGLSTPRAERFVRPAGTVAGWAALACFLLFVGTRLPVFGIGTVMALVGVWCALRLATGILQDSRIRKGKVLVEAWRSDPERARRGLPAPFADYVRTSLGAWWMRLLTPATVIGLFLLIGGASNIGGSSEPDERGFFVGFTGLAATLFLASIVLRLVAGRRSAADHDRFSAYQGPRVPTQAS